MVLLWILHTWLCRFDNGSWFWGLAHRDVAIRPESPIPTKGIGLLEGCRFPFLWCLMDVDAPQVAVQLYRCAEGQITTLGLALRMKSFGPFRFPSLDQAWVYPAARPAWVPEPQARNHLRAQGTITWAVQGRQWPWGCRDGMR